LARGVAKVCELLEVSREGAGPVTVSIFKAEISPEAIQMPEPDSGIE